MCVCISGCAVSLATGAWLQTQHVDVFSLVTRDCRRTVWAAFPGFLEMRSHWEHWFRSPRYEGMLPGGGEEIWPVRGSAADL